MENALTNTNSKELINQARSLSGSFGGSFIPYIPVISINNKDTEKEVEVDGKLVKVKVPAKEGFNITIKDEKTNQYVVQYYGEKLEAVMLRTRYSISSKNMVKPRFYSYEFDYFDDIVKVYDENKQTLIENNYATIKKRFATGEMNTVGKPKTSFDLRVILYIDINGEIFRFKLNNASRSNYFDYIKTFGRDDITTAYKTKFNLKFNDKGQIKFWAAEFERGESVDLAKEIPLLQELQKFFNVERAVKTKETLEMVDQGEGYVEEEIQVKENPEEIRIDQIPF